MHQLESIAPYFAPGQPAPLKNIYIQRRWVDFYGGVMAHRRSNSDESDVALLSPDYTDDEISNIWDGNDFSESYLLMKLLRLNLAEIRELSCPLIIFAGRHDFDVNAQVAAEWFTKVKAPSKQFVWFENSAHLPRRRSQEVFDVSSALRPLAERAGDFAPCRA